jgi:DNA-binding IclR family transcriptional regulator
MAVNPEPKPTVPAVERAVAILRHLQANADPRGGTVTRIAEALGLHKSNCSNILWTLQAAGFVDYVERSRTFELGAELISLGASAARDRDFVRAAAGPMQALVQSVGMTCVAFEQRPNDEFVIVGKAESPREIKVTIDVGQHFHPATPALAWLVVAFADRVRARDYQARWAGRAFTPMTRTDPAEWAGQVRLARDRGYGVSVGEYYAGNTAVAAPVFSGSDTTFRGLCLVEFNEEAAKTSLDAVGRALLAAAETITHTLGGRGPQGS